MGSILVVYLAGAPASVTVEADAGVTVSVAEAASVLCLWSVEAVSLFSADPPLCGGQCQLLLPRFEVFGQGFSPLGPVGCQALPGLCVDVYSLHVVLHDVAVSQLWLPSGSFSTGQLSVQEVFGDAAVWHVVDVA